MTDEQRMRALLCAQADALSVYSGRGPDHIMEGHCPERGNDDERDPQCPACQVLMRWDAIKGDGV